MKLHSGALPTVRLLLLLLAVAPGRASGQEPIAASHRDAVMELLDVMEVEQTIASSLELMTGMMLQGGPPELRGVLDEFFARYFTWPEMEEKYVQLYASTYTEAETRELITFFRTPVGAKSVRLTPVLMQRGAEIGQQQIEDHMLELQKMIGEAMGPGPL
jgi:uncharacterized protein